MSAKSLSIKMLLCSAAIVITLTAVLEGIYHGIESTYRRTTMVRLLQSPELNGGLAIVDLEQVFHHRDRLVELGALFHFKHRIGPVPATPATHREIALEMFRAFPENHLTLLTSDNVLEVYDFPEKEAEWRDFIDRLEQRFSLRTREIHNEEG